MARTVDSQCSTFQCAIEVLGRPWTALLLNVLQAGPLRFSELAETAEGPGDKILSARLKELEARGIVQRSVEAGPPVKVTYSLTVSGRAFEEVAVAIERWGRTIEAEPVPATTTARVKRVVRAKAKAVRRRAKPRRA